MIIALLGPRLAASCVLTVLAASAASAQTGEVDADFSAYCRDAFPGSAYQMRAQPWGTEHYCNQGGTLQGIDLARACASTTSNAGFRVSGSRVLCAPGSGASTPTGGVLTIEDFVRYCAGKFPNSLYERRSESTGPAHYCRRPGASGGFTLQGIDLADACKSAKGGAGFDKVGQQVVCRASASSGGSAGASSGGAVRPPFPTRPLAHRHRLLPRRETRLHAPATTTAARPRAGTRPRGSTVFGR